MCLRKGKRVLRIEEIIMNLEKNQFQVLFTTFQTFIRLDC